jgi:hypothetical protein
VKEAGCIICFEVAALGGVAAPRQDEEVDDGDDEQEDEEDIDENDVCVEVEVEGVTVGYVGQLHTIGLFTS